MPRQKQTERPFVVNNPQNGLSVSYADCLVYVKARLNSFLHGDLKPWLQGLKDQPKPISYTMVVGLKNDTLLRPAPRLVQRILRGFGFETQAVQVPGAEPENMYQFVFPNREQLEVFNQQLARYGATTNPSQTEGK